MLRLLYFSTSMIASIFIAAAALVYAGIYHSEFLNAMMKHAGTLKTYALEHISSDYGVWLHFLLDEKTIVYTVFIIVVRVLLALIGSLFGRLFRSRDPIFA